MATTSPKQETSSAHRAGGEHTLHVGAAAARITPPPGLQLAGYALRTQPADGALADLKVRVTIFDDGATALALATTDLLYTTNALTAQIRSAIAEATPIAPDHVIVTATHTHAGPADLAVPAGMATRNYIAEQAAAAAAVAWAGRRAADLVTGSRHVAGISANRRTKAGPADDLLTVVVALATTDQQPIATIVNFACHATVLGPDTASYSPDYPGAATAALDTWAGGVTTFLQGAAGDINPVTAAATPAECERIGQVLAAAALSLVRDAQGRAIGLSSVSPTFEDTFAADHLSACRLVTPEPLAVRTATVPLTLADPPGPPDPSAAQDELDPAARSMRWIQDLRHEHANLFGASDTSERDVHVQLAHLGADLDLAALPGEPMSAAAARLRDYASATDPDRRLLVAGYAGQAVGYLPMAGDFAHLGYEVGATQYPPGAAEQLLDALLNLMRPQE